MVLATGVIIRALNQRANFYSASVYIAQSNACLMVRVLPYGSSGSKWALSLTDTDESCSPWRLRTHSWPTTTSVRSSEGD